MLAGRFPALLCIALSIALALSAFAHRPAGHALSPEPSAPDLSAYMLPDGGLPDLCIPSEAGREDGASSRLCEYCRLAQAAALPEPPCQPEAMPGASPRLAIRAFGVAVLAKAVFPAAPLRGPPAI